MPGFRRSGGDCRACRETPVCRQRPIRTGQANFGEFPRQSRRRVPTLSAYATKMVRPLVRARSTARSPRAQGQADAVPHRPPHAFVAVVGIITFSFGAVARSGGFYREPGRSGSRQLSAERGRRRRRCSRAWNLLLRRAVGVCYILKEIPPSPVSIKYITAIHRMTQDSKSTLPSAITREFLLRLYLLARMNLIMFH